MIKYIHIHSSNTGSSSPTVKEILEMALKSGTKVISFTDHKTIGAVDDIANLSPEDIERYKEIKVVIGMEHTCKYTYINPKGETEMMYIDILAYNIDINKRKELEKWIKENNTDIRLREIQEKEFERIKNIARQLGLKFDETIKLEGDWQADRIIARSFANYPENYEKDEKNPNKMVLNQDAHDNPSSFFPSYCNDPLSPFYFDRSKYVPDAQQFVKKLKSLVANVVLAHALSYKQNTFEESLPFMKAILDELNGEFAGMETNYGNYSSEEVAKLEKIAQYYELHKAGGSDYHESIGWPRGIGVKTNNGEPIKAGSIDLTKWSKIYSLEEIRELVNKEKGNEENEEEQR